MKQKVFQATEKEKHMQQLQKGTKEKRPDKDSETKIEKSRYWSQSQNNTPTS